jgi:hypothetical protein
MSLNSKLLTDSPVFAVGAERSGTTLLRLMLDHHPKIGWISEFEYAVDWVSEFGDWPDINEYQQYLSKDRIFHSHFFEIDKDLNYPDLIKSFVAQKRAQTGKPLIGANCHRHFDRLLWLWPDARFIHIVRDPRDVARSCVGMGWAGNVYRGVERWIEAEKNWQQLKKKIDSEKILETTYEDFISQDSKCIEQICNFIGTEFSESVFDYTKFTDYTLPNPALLYQWKEKLSDYEIRLVESRVRELMLDSGYESSGLQTLQLTPVSQAKLRLGNWIFRVKFRIKRFGLKLTFADFFTRKLGLKKQQENIRSRMLKITNAYCKFDGNPQILEARQSLK